MKFILLLAAALVVVLYSIGCAGPQGAQGLQGPAGANGTLISINPFCPDIAGVIGYQNRESYVILDSKVYAVYADGTHTFLSLLNPGSYVTTDGRSCHFTVTASGEVQ